MKAKGIEIVEKKSYPLGIRICSPVLRGIKDKNPDAFVGLTYPPDTILASKQSKEIGFNPKVFLHRGRHGVPALQAGHGRRLRRRHRHRLVERQDEPGREGVLRRARRAVSRRSPIAGRVPHCWAGLQILQAAIEKVGVDRKAIRDFIATGEHATIIGPVRFRADRRSSSPALSASGSAATSRSCGLPIAPPPSSSSPSRLGSSRRHGRLRWFADCSRAPAREAGGPVTGLGPTRSAASPTRPIAALRAAGGRGSHSADPSGPALRHPPGTRRRRS